MILWCGHHTALSCAVFAVFVLSSLVPASPVRADQCDDLRVQALGWWEWVSTLGGWVGPVTTPATEGYTLDFELRSDGSFDRYRDGVLERSGTWQLIPWIDLVSGNFIGCRIRVIQTGYIFPLYYSLLYFTPEWMVWDDSNSDGNTIRFQRRDPVSTESISWGMLKAERAGN